MEPLGDLIIHSDEDMFWDGDAVFVAPLNSELPDVADILAAPGATTLRVGVGGTDFNMTQQRAQAPPRASTSARS